MKPRILFWYGMDFTPFCLSYQMKKMMDFDAYAISEVPEKPEEFFKHQNLVSLKNIWFFHENIQTNLEPDMEYLASFEKKFSVDLWKLALNERIFLYYDFFHKFSKNEILSIIESECRFFEKILDEIKPDIFITKTPSLHHLELFSHMCREKKINVITLSLANFYGRTILTNNPSKFDTWNEKLKKFDPTDDDLFNILQEYLKSNRVATQIGIMTKTPNFASKLKYIFELIFSKDSDHESMYTYYGRTKSKIFLFYTLEYILTSLRGKFIDTHLTKNPDLNRSFVFFPLHTEIERQLLISAPFYTNQIELVKTIAKSLPVDHWLFVKEHPFQKTRAWRNPNLYKELLKIPNVQLIHPDYDSFHLYENCSLTITVSGTSGLESLFYKKPVIAFGEINYDNIPSVTIISNINDLPNVIKSSLNKTVDPNDLNTFIANFEKNSSSFNQPLFLDKFSHQFLSGGQSINYKISDTKIEKFLENEHNELEILAHDVIEKIKSKI